MAHADFKPARIRVGDAMQRGYSATCGACGFVGEVPVNSFRKGLTSDEAYIARYIAGKFEARGWYIGERTKDDRCPNCVKLAEKFAKPAAEKPTLKIVEKSAVKVVETIAKKEAPADATPEDRRIIGAKLDDVYDVKSGHYATGWTDQKVATDLGVPRAWVEQVRKLFYGEEASNPEIDALIAEAGALKKSVEPLAANIAKMRTDLTGLIAEHAKLTTRSDMIERRLVEIKKALGA